MFIHPTSLTQVELASAIVRNPLVVTPDTTVMEAIAHMSGVRALCQASSEAYGKLSVEIEARSSCVVIVENHQLAGILTERDVVRLITQEANLATLPICDVMTRGLITLRESEFSDLFAAVELLQKHKIRHLPILDEHDRVVGLLTHESLRQLSRPVDLLRLRTVAEVMTTEVVCADPRTAMREIACRMTQHRVSSVVILQSQYGNGQETLEIPIGIVTERDVVQFQALGLDFETSQVQSVMSAPIFSVQPGDSLWVVQQMMEQYRIQRLAVTGAQGELLGIVTQTNLLQALNPLELYNLAKVLEAKVLQLEAEKIQILQNRTILLEQQVEERTTALKAKAERERLITTISSQIRSSLDLPNILNTTVEEVRTLLGCDRVAIWQIQADRYMLGVAESNADGVGVQIGRLIDDPCVVPDWLEPYRHGRVRVVPDIYTTEMADCHRELLEQLQTRAKILVPIIQDNTLWGLLEAVESHAPRQWQSEEVALLEQLATQLAIAIQRASTHQQLQEELQERQQLIVQLQESEQRYATLTGMAPVGIFRTDTSGYCTYTNERWRQISGLTREEAFGGGWEKGLHPDDRAMVAAEWYRATQENHAFKLEYRFQHSNGTVTWVYGQSVAERDAHGDLIGYVGTITDISDRKQAEESLRQSEARWQFALEGAGDGVWDWNVQTNVAFFSPRWKTMLGYATDEVGDRLEDWESRVHPDDKAHCHAELDKHFRGEISSYQVEHRVGCKDGSYKWILARGKIVEWTPEGQPLRMIGTHTDISDRKQAEDALRASEAYQRALIRSLPDLIMRLDQDGTYREFIAPPTFRVIGGVSNLIGTSIYETLPPPLAQQRMAVVHTAIHTGTIQFYEQDLSADGILQIEEVRVVPSGDHEALLLVRDISDRKRAELTLTKLVAGTATVTGEGFFPALVRHIAEALDVCYALVTEWVEGELHTLAFWAHGNLQPAMSYLPARTPCEFALRDGEFHCASLIQEAFPEDPDLVTMRADSYLGIALKDSFGNAIGNLCILDMQPLPDTKRAAAVPILQVFAARAAAELQRKRADDALHELNQDLEVRVEQRAAELQEREVQLRDFFDNATDLIQSVAPDGQILFVNAAWQEVLGYDDVDLEQLSVFQVIHPDDLEHCRTAMEKLFAGELCLGLETRFLTKDGREITVEGNVNCQLQTGIPIATRGIFRDITARKQAENALRESQQFLQTVLNTFPLAVFWKDRNSKLLGCNQQLAQLLGLASPLEGVGRSNFDFDYTEAEAQGYEADDRQVMESGTAKLGIEETITLPSGEQRWLETNKVPLRDLAGNVVGVVGTFQDISDRKVAEVALAASESFNRQLVEEFPLGLAACRLDGQITYVNSAFAKILGCTIEEVLSLTYWDITPIKYAEQEAEQLQFLKQNGRYGPYEKEFVHKDGHLVPVLLTGLAISQNGEKFIWSSIQDISERKRSEEEIQRLSERLTVALKSGAIGCWEWDILPNTLVWDRRMHELYGIEPSISLLPFDAWSNGVHPDDRSSSQALLQQAVLGQAEFDTEFRVVYPDGSIHFIKGCGVVVRDADNTPQRMIGVNFDISDRKNAEEEIQRKNQELARATRLKDEFLANMSHELRTPLNAILGMAEGLQEEVFGVINKRQIRALQTIERSGLHLLSLINDILDVAKIEAGQIELEYTSISVTHLCSSSLVFIKQQALQKRIRLETKFAPDLTNAFVDERRIRQVLINLLTNAVKFTPEGGTVTLTASPLPQADDATQQHFLRIAVLDTGIGIAPENINKLFQPFVQIDSALNRQYAGTGLGLALVKQIVELHGGRVGLTSELGLGSCFTIDLPCKTELPLAINLPMTGQDDISSMASEAPLTAPLILLAEDNEANISTISSYLTAKGYRIISAKNGEEAIAMAYAESPDLILMDIQMPEVDGLTAIRQLRHDPNFGNIPIIALTALAMASDRERCLEAGANDYLSKPVRLKELAELIKGFCN